VVGVLCHAKEKSCGSKRQAHPLLKT